MKQGEIWEVFLDPVLGSEQGGRRPVVIISGNLVNDLLNTLVVCPLTTKIKNYRGNLIVEPNQQNGLDKTSEVMTIHIRSISKLRLKNKLGLISESEFELIVESLQKIIKY